MNMFRVSCFTFYLSSVQFRVYSVLLSSCLVLIIQSCSSLNPQIDPNQVTPEILLSYHQRSHEKLRTLKGSATLSIESPNLKRGIPRTHTQINLKAPDSLLIVIEGLFGKDVLKILFFKDNLLLYDKMNKQVISGNIHSEDFDDVLPFDIRFNNIVDNITGFTSLKYETIANLDTFALADDTFILRFRDKTSIRTYKVKAKQWNIVQIKEQTHNGETLLIGDFKRFKKYKNMMLPKIVRLRRPMQKEQLTLLYSTRKINDKKPIKFDLKISDDVTYHYF